MVLLDQWGDDASRGAPPACAFGSFFDRLWEIRRANAAGDVVTVWIEHIGELTTTIA
jgi:flagellar basal body L-ring protein FlgH